MSVSAVPSRISKGCQPATDRLHLCGLAEPRGTMAGMTNMASLLKSEISRVARKEVRAETLSLKKAVGGYRAEIAALKKRARALEAELRRLSRAHAKTAPVEVPAQPVQKLRFTAKGLASQRRRLGLSAHECGLLLGTSGQSIYNWEEGKVRPRVKHLPAIAALRNMGKKDAAARLATLG
jgi:DNA-binding transcriptional regulator YiaG